MNWTAVGAVLAGLAVAAGAFGAHGLGDVFVTKYAGQTKEVLGETVPLARKYLADFKTGAEYQMYHALALIAVGMLMQTRPSRALDVAAWSFLIGILVFSGCLYALTLTGQTKLGMIVPIGGVAFLVGWGALAWGAWRS